MSTWSEIIDDLSFLEEGLEQTRYIMELGQKLEKSDTLHSEENKIFGCLSQVWISITLVDGKLQFKGDSDSLFTKGLVAMVLTFFTDKTPIEACELDIMSDFSRQGLQKHISPSRRNGLAAMVKRIKTYAKSVCNTNSDKHLKDEDWM